MNPRVRHGISAAACLLGLVGAARATLAVTLDLSVASGANYDVAEFRLWHADDAGTLRGVVLLVPGSNGDGRPMADDPFWQAFAARHGFAILACRLTDKPHDQMFIEDYVDVSQGSGQAVLDALTTLAERSGHPELAEAPWVSWGMSAGGQVNYEMAAWRPERTIAFILNKGGIYYTALASHATRQVPGLLFVGETDLAFRNDIIRGIFSVNRRAGALWALVEEPGVAHAVNRSRDLAALFFDDIIPLRLPETAASNGRAELKPLDIASGYFGSMTAFTFEPAAGAEAPRVPVAWLPTERVATAWQKVRRGEPFEP
jgi:dienelactone hydrolase